MLSNDLFLQPNQQSPDVEGLQSQNTPDLDEEQRKRLIDLWQKQNPQSSPPEQQQKQLNVEPFKKNFQKMVPPQAQEEKPLNTQPFQKAFEKKKMLEEESNTDWLLRGLARTAKDIGSVVGGSVGDLRDIAEFLTSALPEMPGREERIEKNPLLKYGKKFLKSVVPNSQDIDEFANEMTGGYTEPKTKGEKFGSEVVKTIASRKLVGGSNRATPFARAAVDVGVPLAGELAKEATGYFTDTPTKKEAAKLGTMVMFDLLLGVPYGSTRNYTQQLTNRAEQSIPNGHRALSHPQDLRTSLAQQRTQLTRGGRNATHDPALRRIDEAIDFIDNGTMTRDRAYRLRGDISREVLGRGGYELYGNEAATASRHLQQVRRELTNGMYRDATANRYPNFIEYDTSARRAYRVFQDSNRISNYIKRNYGDPVKSLLVKSLVYSGVSASTAATGGASLAAYQGAKLVDRMIRSPELADLYAHTIRAASQNNALEMKKYLKKLDEKAYEMENSNQDNNRPK